MHSTVVLAGGGTGGHVYPALAMGEALQASGHTLKYMGDARRLEGRVVPQTNIEFIPIPAVQYPRGGIAGKFSFALGLLKAIIRSRGMLKAAQADFVLGVGGYISAPPILAAWTLGIPTAIHEANVTRGLAACVRASRSWYCSPTRPPATASWDRAACHGRLPGQPEGPRG